MRTSFFRNWNVREKCTGRLVSVNQYLKQIKVILSAMKKYRIFSLVTNTIFIFFTVANRGYFDNTELNFFPKRSGPGCSKLTMSLVNVSLKFQKLLSQIL